MVVHWWRTRKMIAKEMMTEDKGLIERWKNLERSQSGGCAIVERTEADLKQWIGFEEKTLRLMRQRAMSTNETPSTIMMIDARVRELGEFRKLLFGNSL
jgi:hypothetical protein